MKSKLIVHDFSGKKIYCRSDLRINKVKVYHKKEINFAVAILIKCRCKVREQKNQLMISIFVNYVVS